MALREYTAAAVHGRLRTQLGFRTVLMQDDVYVAPSVDWLRTFVPPLPSRFGQYVVNRNDCDKAAFGAKYFAHYSLRKTQAAGERGVTFAIAAVDLAAADVLGVRGPGVHAVNLVLCSDDEWYYLEPQTARWENYDRVRRDLSAGLWVVV